MKFKIFLSSLALSSTVFAAEPMFDQQWGLKNTGQKIYRAEGEIRREQVDGVLGVDIDWPGMEELNKLDQGKEVIVAVIDSGIDMNHPDLKDRVFLGKDFLDNADMKDDTGHGTHVAGIIAANSNNIGVQGVAPSAVKILPLKVLSKNINGFVYKGRIITDIIADALAFAVESNVDVINMSLGWPKLVNTPKIVRALDVAAERGIVLVAASGNNNKNVPTWPCAHPAVICVGAIDNQGNISEFSNHGGKVDLVAPGEWIVSTHPNSMESRTLRIQGYEAKNGSSQAAPFVSAAAALIKLKYPNLKAKEIKALLYSSAKPLQQDNDSRFVRFGALSISNALKSEAIKGFASLLVKDLVTIEVNDKGEYRFELPMEILAQSYERLEVSLEGIDAKVTVSENETIQVEGRLDTLMTDSEVDVIFRTDLDGRLTKSPITLSFARKIRQSDLLQTRISGLPVRALVSINGNKKSTSMNYVSVEGKPSADFHGYIYAKSENKFRVITIKANAEDEQTKLTDIILEDYEELRAVIEKDINFDGQNELIFYGVDSDQKNYVLTITDLEGKKIFGSNSRWELPHSSFNGLPEKDEGIAQFSWIKLETFLGELLVPYYQKTWFLPEEDNSNDLLDHEPPNIASRLYYLEPLNEDTRTLLRPRVIDSVAFKQKLREMLTPSPWENVLIERTLPQSTKEKEIGQVRHVVSVGEDFFRRFSIMTVSKVGEMKIEDHADHDVFQVGNMSLITRNLNNFSVSKNSFQMALLDRSSARVKPFVEGSSSDAWILLTSGWSNPFFEVAATFESDNRRTLFFESRYHVYVYDQKNNQPPKGHRLPINRDSSFPGVNFSETLQSAVVKSEQGNQPAIAVNSTLIYGDRLYTMVSGEDSFIRPVALSVNIPPNCVPLKSQYLSNSQSVSSYVMLCQNTSTSVDLSFFPLILK